METVDGRQERKYGEDGKPFDFPSDQWPLSNDAKIESTSMDFPHKFILSDGRKVQGNVDSKNGQLTRISNLQTENSDTGKYIRTRIAVQSSQIFSFYFFPFCSLKKNAFSLAVGMSARFLQVSILMRVLFFCIFFFGHFLLRSLFCFFDRKDFERKILLGWKI